MRPSAKSQRVEKVFSTYPVRTLSEEEVPLGVVPLWKGDSFFVWHVETGELYEACISKPFYRQIPGVFKYEFRDLVVEEISLVTQGACRYAKVALIK
jgi:hypothetical protein